MKALLVRVGIDSSTKSGHWNAPVNPRTGEFVYVPIREDESGGEKKIRPGYETYYDDQFKGACQNLGVKLPEKLYGECAHLDPDFRYLTYGDERKKAAQLEKLNLGEDDILAFYTSLESIKSGQHKPGELIYAMIGLYVLACKPKKVGDIPEENWHRNAHTRRYFKEDDIVFSGKKDSSGRLKRCICIGEYCPTKGLYYLKSELQEKWGEAKAMCIQRGIHPLHYPEKFCDWFENEKKKIGLMGRNN